MTVSLLLGACSGSSGTTDPAPSTLHARGMLLAPGEEIVLDLDGGASGYKVRADFSPQDARVELCALETETGAPGEGGCLFDLAWGVRTPVAGIGVESLRLRVMDQPVTMDLVVEYFEKSRSVGVTLPRVPQAPSDSACLDNACNPIFELLPVRSGSLTAEASFGGERAELVLLSGRILGRSQTATGVPYREAAKDSGGSPLAIAAKVTGGDEFAVALRQKPGAGAQGLREVSLTILWP